MILEIMILLVLVKEAHTRNQFTGIVVWSECKDHKLGDYDTHWDIEQFKKYTGEVTLSNKRNY